MSCRRQSWPFSTPVADSRGDAVCLSYIASLGRRRHGAAHPGCECALRATGAAVDPSRAAGARSSGSTRVAPTAGGRRVGFAVEEQSRLTCLGGELWVTGPGTDDQILVVGESLTMTGPGRVVAEALRAARFVILR